jgi:kynurenine formamidase
MLRLVDLSQDLYHGVPNFACDPQTAIFTHLQIVDRGYNNAVIVTGTHQGTHMDAPYHFFDDGLTVEKLDVRRGFGPAWVLDFTQKRPKEEITVSDVKSFSNKIKRGDRLIFRTGWDKVFPEKRYFSDQPYLGVETCQWIADQGVICVAIDAPTIYPANYMPVHHALLNKKAEVLIIESLMHLDQLQSEQVILIALPLRIQGRDGSPCRAMAIDGDIQPYLTLFEMLNYEASV